jgi:predicted transposase YbfD/YdcC
MGCQRNIAKKIIARKADYILALKGNQGTLHEDVELFANEQKANGFKDTTISRNENLYRDPRCRLAARAARLAGIERRRHGREQA